LNDVIGAFLDVVRVDQQNGSGIRLHELPERLDLSWEGENVAVRHRAGNRHTPYLSGQDTGCRIDAADIKPARLLECRVGAMHATDSEVHNRTALRGPDDT
jgi:hypothetical protein